jgi:anti-sigma factor RsiW
LDRADPAAIPAEVTGHIAGCPACSAFAARQQAVDMRLRGMLVPPEMSPAFRPALRRRIRQETAELWTDFLPDKVHFVSCGLATAVCAVVMPFSVASVLSLGATATAATYVLMTAVRNLFESD